jgi:AraC-like DNA-binding protein
VPDGCVDIVWLATGPVWVCGPETAAWSFTLPAGTQAAGVRFRPGAARHALRCDADEMRDRRIPLADLVGPAEARRWAERFAESSPEARAGVATAAARSWLRAARTPDLVEAELVRRLTEPGPRPLAALAHHVGLTSRQLHRRCLRTFGYPAGTLTRIVRFQRLVEAAISDRGDANLARLAAEHGYSDQSHLVRDCRAITGESPSVYLSGRHPTFPTMSDPYKPETLPEGHTRHHE